MKKLFVLTFALLAGIMSRSQSLDNPLVAFDYYMGVWLLPSDHPAVAYNPKLVDLQVISFKWGTQRKVIHSTTGIVSEEDNIPFSEGLIVYNPRTKTIPWIEYQYDGDLFFDGTYTVLENGQMQRLYTVNYVVGDKTIPHPEEEGWTRLYRETFIPISRDTIDWVTETYIGGEWIEAGTPGGSSAVRKK